MSHAMDQLTVRGFEPQLAQALQRISREEHVSLNQAALRLMRKGAGIQVKKEAGIGHQLDEFVGSWSADESALFDQEVDELRVIDDELWQ